MKTSMKIFCIAFMIFASMAWGQTAVFTEISGKVEIKAPGGGWVAARNGMSIAKGTIIATGFRSQATIKLPAATIYVKNMTRLTLEELVASQGEIKTGLYIRTGSMEAQVDKTPSGQDFRVRSPVSTAAVRGTRIIYDGSRLKVLEGRATLFNIIGQPTNVMANNLAESRDGVDLITPRRFRLLNTRINPFISRIKIGGKSVPSSTFNSFFKDPAIVVFELLW
ncbi:MAG: hypothetical protein EHM28_01095 [Spirochaetaceae bacterium]|nr:MAG: hypothetical protein EHM28_01095 [Spirochaetaceae bacterium]